MSAYAELQITSNFTFLEGASHPEELAMTAKGLGWAGFALTDRNSLAGIVRAHVQAKPEGIPFIVGCRLDLSDFPSLLVWVRDRTGYAALSNLITAGRRRAPKGDCHLTFADVAAHAPRAAWAAGLVPPDEGAPTDAQFEAARALFGRDLSLALTHRARGDDGARLASLAAAATRHGVALLATGDVLYHVPERRPIQDLLTCIRLGVTIDAAGWRLAPNADRHAKSPAELARLFADHPLALRRSLDIAESCRFSLDELRYEYPDEVAEGGDPMATLRRLVAEHLPWRYPDGAPRKVLDAIAHELTLIEQLNYPAYFLTVHDLVRFARGRGILCQGRGSAANSAVCYVLGVTAVDPAKHDLLFERFVSAARNEPPDIDVDFEHERREEVIQYIYQKYGRDRAGLVATINAFRARGALRETGKAMGLSQDAVERLAGSVWGWTVDAIDPARIAEAGLDPAEPRIAQTIDLARHLVGFPRHLSQHVGGFVMTRGRLTDLAPVLNATMVDRTTLEWDKDDVEALGLLKVDVLALGMLTCVAKAFALLERHYGLTYDLATVPREDPAVYDMLCRGDSLGVFQVESRAQMAMLPRLRPRCFYDLVIEVAIVRPGPIQGDMVHPYLRRRQGLEPVELPSEELREVLGRTLGVPLFQEQAMKIAIVAAGFTPDEADRLRRAMATFKKIGIIHTFREKLIEGMVARGYERTFAERCFRQIEGFGTYGFPESHAASFAHLVYVSSWLKCHHPEVFAAALLNSQPMGFYAPAQIVRDAQEHGVLVLEPDVNRAGWDCDLEPPPALGPRGSRPLALRLGLRHVKGLGEAAARALVAARPAGGYRSIDELWRATHPTAMTLDALARADAFRSMGLDRRRAGWAVRALGAPPPPLLAALETPPEPEIALPEMPLGEHVVQDYASLRLSLKAHPVGLLRPTLAAARPPIRPCAALAAMSDGRRATVAGLVLVRQRPGTAKGIVFVTLEDETGIANLVCMPDIIERDRAALLGARLLQATGFVQKTEGVIHLRVSRLFDRSALLADLSEARESYDPADMAGGLANADEVRRPNEERRGARARRVFPDGRNFR